MDEIELEERSQSEREEHRKKRGGSLRGQHHPTNPWEAEIDVTLTDDGSPPQFEIATCLPTDGAGNIIFNNAGRPGFKLKFRLYDNTNGGNGSGYAFPQGANNQDALWSKVEAVGCPASGVWEVFPQNSIVVTDNGATLMVLNPNPSPPQGTFRYTLNVIKPGATAYLPLDPGGTNNNGSSAR